jgi:hypothetical protein
MQLPRPTVLAPLLIGLSLMGAAPDRPPIPPRRDAAVTYQVGGAAAQAIPGGVPGLLTVRWDAAGQRLRAEAEGRTQAVLIDLRTRQGSVIDTGLHAILPLRTPDPGAMLRLDGARFTRAGQDRVAGATCTNWTVQHPKGNGTICVTADGVPLRGEGTVDGKQGNFVATSIDLSPQPDALFRAPPGYQTLNLPDWARGLQGGKGGGGLPDLRGLLRGG